METVSNNRKKPRGTGSSAGEQKITCDSSVLLFKLEEQQKLINDLKLCLKTSEDKRKVMETRGKNLFMENQKLKSLFETEHSKVLELQKKLHPQDKVPRIKDSYTGAKRKDSSGRLKSSTKSLPMVKESSTQTALSKESHNYSPKQQNTEGSGTDANSDVNTVVQDLQQLKELLNKREQTWTKIAERDRELRERINLLSLELSSVRQIATTRSEDLHKKSAALKSKKCCQDQGDWVR